MKQFNLAEWALKHKSIIYYFMAVLLTFGISHTTIWAVWKTLILRCAPWWSALLARAPHKKMSDQVTDKLEEKLRDPPWRGLYKIFPRWQQISYLY